MWRKILAAIVIGLFILSFIDRVRAQQTQCIQREQMVSLLAKRFKEAQHGVGSIKSYIFELYVSKAGTWTVIRTDVRGISCIVVSGVNWETLPLTFPDPET